MRMALAVCSFWSGTRCALPKRSGVARVAGSIIDAPMPSMSASPTSRLGTDHDSAASSEPPPKSAAPMMNMRR